MRSMTIDGVTLQYPDALGFVFNPVLFVCEGCKRMRVRGWCDGLQGQAFYDADANGKVYADFQSFAQALFGSLVFEQSVPQVITDTQLGRTFAYNVQVTLDDDTTVNFLNLYVFTIWGAMAPTGRDVFNGERRVKVWRNYPFAFGLYANGNSGTLLFRADGSFTPQTVSLPQTQGMYSVPVDALPSGANTIEVYDYAGVLQQATFDFTFDFTFYLNTNTPMTKIMQMEVESCQPQDFDRHVYLRWVNRHGFYCYWLFEKKTEQRKVSAIMDMSRPELEGYTIAHGYQRGAGRRAAYSREDILPVCAPMVDALQYDYLFDIATSPVVDMYSGDGVWVAVNAQAGTYNMGSAELQDFVVNIKLPTIPIQRL